MTIKCSNLRPLFLPAAVATASGLWGKCLEWRAEEKIQVLAPSGAGKTTLLHVLYGIRGDYQGTVLLGDDDVRNFGAKQWAAVRQRRLAIVFQQLRLFPYLTAEQNIRINAALTGKVDPAPIAEMSEMLGIGNLLAVPCGRLSLGEQQRVAIVRALVQPFEWLLLDEPFSHLDEALRQKATELVHRVCKRRRAGFVLTSLENVAQLGADRTVTL